MRKFDRLGKHPNLKSIAEGFGKAGPIILLLSASSLHAIEYIYDGDIIDRSNIVDGYPSHLFVNQVHQVWFCSGSSTGKDGIFLTTNSNSLDSLGSWSQPVEVLTNSTVPWADQHICDPSVLHGVFNYGSEDYEFIMYFTADDGSTPGGIRNAIGVAFSHDGFTWVPHSDAIIMAQDPTSEEYGAGGSSAFWNPISREVGQIHRDSTADAGFFGRVFFRSSSDGVVFSDPPLDTLLPEAGITGADGLSPVVAFNPQDGYWYAVISALKFDPVEYRVRLLRSSLPGDLFSPWNLLAEWGMPETGEVRNIEPGLARNENGTLFIDSNGWIFIFLTIGEDLPNFGTWRIAQVRYRLQGIGFHGYQDGFAEIGSFRENGRLLDGTNVELGEAIWSADSGVIFENGHITAMGNAVALLPIEAEAEYIQAEADVNAAGSDWAAIALLESDLGGVFSQGSIWMNVSLATGKARTWINGTDYMVGEIDLSSLPSPGGSHRLRLAYESTSNRVSSWIDGQFVANSVDVGLLGGVGLYPNVSFGGLHINNGLLGQTTVDDFAVGNAVIFSDGFECGDTSRWLADAESAGLNRPLSGELGADAEFGGVQPIVMQSSGYRNASPSGTPTGLYDLCRTRHKSFYAESSIMPSP